VEQTVIDQGTAGTGEPYAVEPAARTTATDQVVVGDIPAQRPGFQPRPALLAKLNQASQEPPVVVLTGARGVGKTQLAAAYARARLAGGWRLIAWINAQNRESLLAGLSAVTEATARSDGGTRQSAADAAQALRRSLEADGSRCLLVLDDGQDLGLLRPFLPAVGAARVLIIGARERAGGWGTSVPVGVFSAEEAVALLDGRTGLDDQAGASAVATELGHLPLALDQAAAVIAGEHLGYEAYLAKLRALRAEDHRVRDEDGEEQRYPPGAAEVVLLSLEAARAADPLGVAAGIMEIMAMLSPAAVRRNLLRAAGQEGTLLGGGRRVAASMVDRALEQLNERSLLGFSRDGQTVSVYCLVARVVHRELARRERLVTACRAAASALEMSAEELVRPGDQAAAAELLGQITALLSNAGTLADDPGEQLPATLMRLRSLALRFLIELGDSMPQALAAAKPLTADFERTLGPGHPDTLSARDSLAAAYQGAGLVGDAIPLFERTLVDRERTLGPDHPDTLTSQNKLAAAYQDAGRDSEAILLFRLTLAVRERLLGPDHPDTLHSRTSLAAAYRDAGRAVDAIPLAQQTLAAREELLGADHPNTLASRNNLASVYRAAGRPAEAVPLFEQNVAACERLLGPDDPRTVASRHHLDLARHEAEPAPGAGLAEQVGGDLQDDGA
jgi:tetratricopeptide (TPR) repeat protein